jgi:hypothetical protein
VWLEIDVVAVALAACFLLNDHDNHDKSGLDPGAASQKKAMITDKSNIHK